MSAMALRYFLVETQIPEFTYVMTTQPAMLLNYKRVLGHTGKIKKQQKMSTTKM